MDLFANSVVIGVHNVKKGQKTATNVLIQAEDQQTKNVYAKINTMISKMILYATPVTHLVKPALQIKNVNKKNQ